MLLIQALLCLCALAYISATSKGNYGIEIPPSETSTLIVKQGKESRIPKPKSLYKLPDMKPFPKGFKFGVSTSSYQVEGGWLDGGKGPTLLDVEFHIPGTSYENDNGDVANDMYHLYPEDIQQMKAFGITNYRFSLNWARILPTGKDKINPDGVAYYNDLINKLLEAGIEPHVTLYHGETPAALAMWPNPSNVFLNQDNFVKWFTDFADVVFESFGDRVKNWFTFNEPFCISVYGPINDGIVEYQTAHTLILAHASTYRLYESKYKAKQGGTVGIVLNTAHFYPLDNSSADDIEAAGRGYDFWYNWFLSPLVYGEYPVRMQNIVGDRLPKFTSEQLVMVKGAIDFVAINYYFPYLTSPGTALPSDPTSFDKDMNTTTGFGTWPLSQTGWGMYGPGLKDVLLYTKANYPHLPQYITENGLAWQEDTIEDAVEDSTRQQYLHDHITAVGDALTAGADVRGYFIWSWQNNLEWGSGYKMTFGIIYIMRDEPSLTRVPKGSLYWYSEANSQFKKLHS